MVLPCALRRASLGANLDGICASTDQRTRPAAPANVAFLYAAITEEAEGLALNVGGDAPVSLTALAEHVVTANGGGKYNIREFPPERKRIDIGDFLTDDRRFRALSGWHPRFCLAEGLRQSLKYYRRHLASYL